MPLLAASTYRSPWWLPGGHGQTIGPALWRGGPVLTPEAETLELADGDFLNLQWRRRGNERLVIFCHGLESHARASYIREVGGVLAEAGWDVLAWSYRGCGEELNRLPQFYHSGATPDLAAVVAHALATHPARQIDLVGFSLGGNLVLKYLGEQGGQVHPRLHRAVTFSVPCDLACSAEALDTAFNREVYMGRFIKTLREKIQRKHELFPEDSRLLPAGVEKIRTFRQFDDRYTAPLHGFRDAADYWARSSSRPFLKDIRLPALLVNALNDPFLGPRCYPRQEAEESRFFHLEIPSAGGHVGFQSPGGKSWMGTRVKRFLAEGE
ncbi:YheT family hydrolase [Roseibacillus ishigakijimensis]|uniref:Alpha/beta fold hydrolase n=1 Tax=Roseibacillus ishigakijimensis TaxID=454146 RepID=A0A934RWI9_9BACT|nr:alpha/beta fold hydrolase [Roseibacillus ishigakijimensis]MBK1835455.1 alpha/beta fold hydrolase [Roseibacillus ishigakijimensis]